MLLEPIRRSNREVMSFLILENGGVDSVSSNLMLFDGLFIRSFGISKILAYLTIFNLSL